MVVSRPARYSRPATPLLVVAGLLGTVAALIVLTAVADPGARPPARPVMISPALSTTPAVAPQP